MAVVWTLRRVELLGILAIPLVVLVTPTSCKQFHVDDTCITDPTPTWCKDYKLPYVEQDLQALCDMMPQMPGCTIRELCKLKSLSQSRYCVPFSLLKDICLDMSWMSPCKNYTSMCRKGSTVVQCATPSLDLPSTVHLAQLIKDICNEMNMPGCSKCNGEGMWLDCDMLQVYSQMCLAMPDMKSCGEWQAMCIDIPDWPLCTQDVPGIQREPEMKPYFHTGIVDYLLLRQLVPQNNMQYAFAWILVFVAAMGLEILKLVRALLEKKWKKNMDEREALRKERQKKYHTQSPDPKEHLETLLPHQELETGYESTSNFFAEYLRAPFRANVDIPRALLQTVEVGWGLLVMLVAMTFNVGFFAAILAGTFVGSLFVGRYVTYEPKNLCH